METDKMKGSELGKRRRSESIERESDVDADEEAAPSASNKPYIWDDGPQPPAEVLQLWLEVGNRLDKDVTVVWKNAVESLHHTLKYLTSAPEAREFCERYMLTIIRILVEQVPWKIGVHERSCVQESLILSVRIVAKDLTIQVQRGGTCELLPTLALAFDRKRNFYSGGAPATGRVINRDRFIGIPEARFQALENFRAENGFQHLHEYLRLLLEPQQTVKPPSILCLKWLHHILLGLGESISPRVGDVTCATVSESVEEEAIILSELVIKHIRTCTEEDLRTIPIKDFRGVFSGLHCIFDQLLATRRTTTYEFYNFWRSLVLDLIKSPSGPLKLRGWIQVGELIRASWFHYPPPRSFEVMGAGCSFVNGTYEYAGEVTPDGYARPQPELKYVHHIPATGAPEMAGKKITLFRCTMRSRKKWWFLSKADDQQPGTDRDVDFYHSKAKDWEGEYPPTGGWITCRDSGVDPAPRLKPQGLMVPVGSELQTLDQQLVKWVVENDIIEQVLGDTTIYREVDTANHSEVFLLPLMLVNFLALMRKRPVLDPRTMDYLQTSHLPLGRSPLYHFARDGLVDAVRVSLRFDVARVNSVDSTTGATPLWIAAKNGHASLVQELLKARADIRIRNYNGETPLGVAFRKGHNGVVYLLLRTSPHVWPRLASAF